ncbi:MAG: XRE family transcriptional regulator [Desulfurellales bacterium]|nr:MAG: XRE family transcriptional regulator [Desulfurellales bacterium]
MNHDRDLRTLRIKARTSREKMAQQIGIPYERYRKLEVGLRHPTPEEIRLINRAFNERVERMRVELEQLEKRLAGSQDE